MSVSVKPMVEAEFGLKGLKKWDTHDGGGYSFTLTHHGKPVAEVLEEGHGGEIRVSWSGLTRDGSVMPRLSPADTKKAALAQAAKVILDKIVETTPEFESYGMMLKANVGIFLEQLLIYTELQKLCKNKTVFRLPENPDHDHILKAPFDMKVRAYIQQKWPTAIILNENPFA